MSMHIYYELTLHVERLVGGIPKHPKLIKSWQEARFPAEGPKTVALAEIGVTPETATQQTIEDLGSNAQSAEEVAKVSTGFVMMQHPKFGEIAAIEPRRNVKAMLKESANIIKGMPEARVRGKEIALRAKLAERVFPGPKFAALLNEDGTPSKIESVERPIHVMTRQGPRTALKQTDFADDVVLVSVLKVLNDGLITESILRAILEHASDNGIGTDRSQGVGMFSYKLIKLDD